MGAVARWVAGRTLDLISARERGWPWDARRRRQRGLQWVSYWTRPVLCAYENHNRLGFNGLVVMISVLHTEGLRFDPGLNQFLLRVLTTYWKVIFLKNLGQKSRGQICGHMTHKADWNVVQAKNRSHPHGRSRLYKFPLIISDRVPSLECSRAG
jgi:hypothetical protein